MSQHGDNMIFVLFESAAVQTVFEGFVISVAAVGE